MDLEADVLPRLTLGIAGRFEDYASFGSTSVGKIQARFEINDSIALRATASTGFHAPSPGQSNVETLSTTFTTGNDDGGADRHLSGHKLGRQVLRGDYAGS